MPTPDPLLDLRQDTRTIFYDVYIDRSTRHLCGIGPALINLKDDIFPLEIFIKKRPIKFALLEVEKLVFLESKEPIDEDSEIVEFVLRFNKFQCSLKLINSFHHPLWSASDENGRLTISTLQKDNPIVWIKDWIRWHCRLYGVRRVILYDNGSSNQQELIKNLRELDTEVEIIFVHWDFPFGLHSNRYTQRGSLNHCRMRFRPINNEKSIDKQYCINLDVDEYLVSPHRKNLYEYLESNLNSSQLYAVVAKEVRVPNILPVEFDVNTTQRFFNFRYRYSNHKESNDSLANTHGLAHHKYIYRFGSLLYNDTHRISPNFHRLNIAEKFLLYLQILPAKISRNFWRLKRYLRISPVDSIKPQYHSILASESDLYYLHFIGLACKWNDRSREVPERYSEDRHIESEMICDLARAANLTNSSM